MSCALVTGVQTCALPIFFVVSKDSVDPSRTGVRNELSVADAMRKTLNDPEFIIPARIDATPFSDFPIQIHQLNGIDFSKGWGPKQLGRASCRERVCQYV